MVCTDGGDLPETLCGILTESAEMAIGLWPAGDAVYRLRPGQHSSRYGGGEGALFIGQPFNGYAGDQDFSGILLMSVLVTALVPSAAACRAQCERWTSLRISGRGIARSVGARSIRGTRCSSAMTAVTGASMTRKCAAGVTLW
ncbi:hypothetical protein AAAC12_36450 [Pseudomonas aeruginosa]|uniref:hypothetical protein n=1 Tax=Pseudomonas aeruginosa TaxID=287 RepID=UPI0030F0E0E0